MKAHPRTLYVGASESVIRDALTLLLSEAFNQQIAVVAVPQLLETRLGSEHDALLWCGSGTCEEFQMFLRRSHRSRRVILSTALGEPTAVTAGVTPISLTASTESWLQSIREALHLTPRASRNEESSLAPLGEREREVFQLLVDGLPNRSIAARLKISPRTVETHRARILKKLDCASNAELVKYAVRHRLLADI